MNDDDVLASIPSPKSAPAVIARRIRFTRWVKGVVGVCLALCTVALAVGVWNATHPSDDVAARTR